MSSTSTSDDEAIRRMMECKTIANTNPSSSDETKKQQVDSIQSLIDTRSLNTNKLLNRFKCPYRDAIVAIRDESDKLDLLEEACKSEKVPMLFLSSERLGNFWYCGAFVCKEDGIVWHSCGEHLCIRCAGYRSITGKRAMFSKIVKLGEGDMASLTLSVPVYENPSAGWSRLQFAMKGLRNRINAERERKRHPSPAGCIVGYSLRWDLAKVDGGYRHHVHGIIKLRPGSNQAEVQDWIEGVWVSLNGPKEGVKC